MTRYGTEILILGKKIEKNKLRERERVSDRERERESNRERKRKRERERGRLRQLNSRQVMGRLDSRVVFIKSIISNRLLS